MRQAATSTIQDPRKGPSISDFDQSYFSREYRDYSAQNPPRKLDHYLEVVRTLAPPNGRVLDVGCGLGVWAAYMAQRERTWSVCAMDLDPSVIEENQERFPQVGFSVGGIGDPNHHTEKFDVITAMDVFEHVPQIDTRLPRLLDLLVDGGFLVAVMPVYDGPLGPIVRILDKDPTHIHKWPREWWLDLLKGELKDLQWHGLFRYLLPGQRYLHFATSSLRSVAPAIMTVGRYRPNV